MAVARYYASNAVDTTLSAGISSADTTITVGSVSGFPGSYPYTLAIDYDTSSEELVDVTAASGTTLTITRAVDSTTAVAHSSAANVKHVISGRDMRETQEHYNATGRYSVANGTTTEYFNLHGLGVSDGNVVGTDKAQTLTAKTLTSPTINSPTLGGTITNNGTISGGTITATTAATLATARNINGVVFNGSADITVPAAAGTLTGSALASGVTSASGLTVTQSQVTNLTMDLGNKLTNPGAWTTWTPTLSWTLNGSSNSSKYIQIGKTVYFNFIVQSTGTITPSGTFTFTLPVQPIQGGISNGYFSVASTNYPINTTFNTVSTTAYVYVPTATSVTANTPLTSLALTSNIVTLGTVTTTANRYVNISGFYEVA
jgi:hypothetical protein